MIRDLLKGGTPPGAILFVSLDEPLFQIRSEDPVHLTDLLISDVKKIEVLKALSDGKVHAYYNLSQLVRTNYDTVKRNCRFLEILGYIEIARMDKEESASGAASYRVRITQDGVKAIGILKKNSCRLIGKTT